MIKLSDTGVFLINGREAVSDGPDAAAALLQKTGKAVSKEEARRETIAWSILDAHNTSGDMENLRLKFDAMASHDITYVGIIQTARASGLTRFPIPYVLTNCHNSLCAVGGTINEDDHRFAISAAKKYGGIYVPPHLAVIHQYMREMMAGGGRMILGSDSHTRYGALGTLAIGEGGGELAKQLLGRTYDVARPGVVAVYLTGAPRKGVGPQDVALSIIGAVFGNGYVKNKVMEFVGDGVENLGVEYRNGIDVMTTETTCLSSVWRTDEKVRDYLAAHGRADAYKKLEPGAVAYYDGMVTVDLSAVRPMIALPSHPSNVYPIEELLQNPREILAECEKKVLEQFGSPKLSLGLADKVHDGGVWVDQGVIAGCAGGTYDNICEAADILAGRSTGTGAFSLSAYPSSQPTYLNLVQNGAVEKLMTAGVIVRSAFCGPCFGAGDTPANRCLSIRHTTRNFPNREGSKPGEGQLSAVALMDARSIAATAANGGRLTPATEADYEPSRPAYRFDPTVYQNRVYQGFGHAEPETPLVLGPNIADWPEMPRLTDDLLLKVVSFITDPVTTTDELIPSGETSSYRSNPRRLAEFALSRRDPSYVPNAKEVEAAEQARERGERPETALLELSQVYEKLKEQKLVTDESIMKTGIGSCIYATKPGDGSAREQAASCQKVLGGWGNVATEYATKRYRSNLINWGILPFLSDGTPHFRGGDYLFIPGVRAAVLEQKEKIDAYVVMGREITKTSLSLGTLTDAERKILAAGCLINHYRGAE